MSTTTQPSPNTETKEAPATRGSFKRNSVELIGNVGRVPELRYTPQGTPVISFSVAVKEEWDNGNGPQVKTHWVDIVQWGQAAEQTGQIVDKGDLVGLQGKLSYREWEAQDTTKRRKLEVVAFEVQVLKKAKSREG